MKENAQETRRTDAKPRPALRTAGCRASDPGDLRRCRRAGGGGAPSRSGHLPRILSLHVGASVG